MINHTGEQVSTASQSSGGVFTALYPALHDAQSDLRLLLLQGASISQ